MIVVQLVPMSLPRWNLGIRRVFDTSDGQDHEVRYEAKKEGVSKDTVKKAVKSSGNSRKKVEAELRSN